MLLSSSPLSSEVTELLSLFPFTFPFALLLDFGVDGFVESLESGDFSLESGDFSFNFSFFLKKSLTLSRTSSWRTNVEDLHFVVMIYNLLLRERYQVDFDLFKLTQNLLVLKNIQLLTQLIIERKMQCWNIERFAKNILLKFLLGKYE